MFSPPDNQVSLAVDEKRFAEWAEPLSLRQREQWHKKKLSNSPEMQKVTVPQRHCPLVGLSSIRTPLSPCYQSNAFSLIPCIRLLDHGQKEGQADIAPPEIRTDAIPTEYRRDTYVRFRRISGAP